MELRTLALRLAKQVPAYASLATVTHRAAASSVVKVMESATGGQSTVLAASEMATDVAINVPPTTGVWIDRNRDRTDRRAWR